MTGLMQILPNNNCSGILTLREIQFWKRHYFQKILFYLTSMGGDLEGDWGDGPPKCQVGEGSCIHPNILRSTVIIGCVAKYELTKKVSWGNFCSEIEVYRQEKGHTC